MLPPKVIDKLRRDERERREDIEQPALRIPLMPDHRLPSLRRDAEEEDQTFNGVIVIDLA